MDPSQYIVAASNGVNRKTMAASSLQLDDCLYSWGNYLVTDQLALLVQHQGDAYSRGLGRFDMKAAQTRDCSFPSLLSSAVTAHTLLHSRTVISTIQK